MTSDKTNAMGFGDLDESLHRIVDDFTSRLRKGERVTPDGFAAQYPQYADSLRALLPVVSVMSAFAEVSEPGPSESPAFASSESGCLGDFRIIREIGRGGMGVVYEAEQVSLCRRVALKVLPLASLLDQRHLVRFKNESRAAAMLKHPHIVSVFQIGCERGVHYYAMDLVPGRSLATIIQELQLARQGILRQEVPTLGVNRGDPALPPTGATTPMAVTNSADTIPIAQLSTEIISEPRKYCQRVARLGMQVANALHYAHQAGIIHRDIKPSNILLDDSGCPWVADFGLAHVPGAENATLSGDILGTLRYMSPEQAAGRKLLDERTDVYSLGLTLFEFLTLQPAFAAADHPALLHDVLHCDPMAAHIFPSSIPFDLQTILLKATAKEASDRYANAEEFSDDLERFLQQRPIRARPLGRIARVWRWCRRSPAFATTVSALFMLMLLTTALAGWLAIRESWHRRQADLATSEAQWQQYLSDMHAAMAAWEDSNVGQVMQLLERHRRPVGQTDYRGFEWYYLWGQCQYGITTPSIKLDGDATALALSPDNQLLAVSTGFRERPVTTTIYDVSARKAVREIATNSAFCLTFSPDGQHVAGEDDAEHVVRVWNVATGECVHTLKRVNSECHSLSFAPNGQLLAIGSDDGLAEIWNLAVGQLVWTFRDHSDRVRYVAWLDPETLLTLTYDGVVRCWNVQTGELRRILCHLPPRTGQGALSPDRSLLAVSGTDTSIRLVDTRTGQLVDALSGNRARIWKMAFSHDGRYLASAGDDHRVLLWDIDTRQIKGVFRGHSGHVTGIAFCDDDKRLISASLDETVRLWTLGDEPESHDVCRGHMGYVLDVAFDHTGNMLVSSSADRTARVWNAATAAPLHVLAGHKDWVDYVVCSPVDPLVATRSLGDHSLRLWDLLSGTPLWTVEGLAARGNIAFSANGEHIYSAEDQSEIRVWNVRTGKPAGALPIAGSSIRWVQTSRDGLTLATATTDGKVLLVEADSGAIIRELSSGGPKAEFICYSADGKLLAARYERERLTRVWETATGRELSPIQHVEHESVMTFSLDNKLLASSGWDNAVHLWDVARQQERAVLRSHWMGTNGVAFSPNGKVLATAGDDRMVRLWRAVAPPDDN